MEGVGPKTRSKYFFFCIDLPTCGFLSLVQIHSVAFSYSFYVDPQLPSSYSLIYVL